jgi:uncharacterized protein with GYD domain
MIFITQGRYTEQARAGMLAHPEDRSPALEELLKAAGVKLVNAFWTFGEYDFLVIVDAPDEHVWMQVLLVTASTGGLTNLRTMLAMSTADGEKDYEAAAKLAKDFQAAGGA